MICGCCGKEGAEEISLMVDGKCEATVYGCRRCTDKVDMHLDRVEPIFDAMIDAGVPEDVANETMDFLLDRFDADMDEDVN